MARFKSSDGVFRFFERCLDECSDICNTELHSIHHAVGLSLSRLGFCPKSCAQCGRRVASQREMLIGVTLT